MKTRLTMTAVAVATAFAFGFANDSLAQSGSANIGGGAAGGAVGGAGGGATGGTGTGTVDSTSVGGGGSSSSTGLSESVNIGRAAVIDAAGRALEAQGAAVKDFEDAREQYIENRVAAFEAENRYLRALVERHQLRDELREVRRPRNSTIRQVSASRKSPVTDRIDSKRGLIAWPSVLLADEFTPQRTRVEQLLKAWSDANAAERFEIDLELRSAADSFKRQIRPYRDTLPVSSFLAGIRFVDGLRLDGISTSEDLSRPPVPGKDKQMHMASN